MAHLKRDGVSLHYLREGSGAPPFVFVHGWCCDHTFFEPQVDHFKASHSVTALDLRGCGKSDRPQAGYDIPTLAEDVAWLCDQQGISKPVIVGHSLGGMIAIEVAARRPSLPAAIVAADPGAIDPLPEASRFFRSFAAQLEGTDGDEARRAYVDGLFLSTDSANLKRRVGEAMGSVPLDIAAAMIRGIVSWDGVGALAQCQSPLLVLLRKTGTSNDPARLLARKPDLHIGVTVGAGHFHQLEVPEQVTAMIDRFVRITTRGAVG